MYYSYPFMLVLNLFFYCVILWGGGAILNVFLYQKPFGDASLDRLLCSRVL